MAVSAVVSFACLGALASIPEAPEDGLMPTSVIVLVILAFFLLSMMIAMISVIAGIGGGVIFTPIMLAFTNINSLVVRGTGFIVAMFSGPISAGIFIKKGLANYRLCLVMTLSQGIGALAGSMLAVATAENSGLTGEGMMRLALGLILFSLAAYFMSGGKTLENPVVGKVDRFTEKLALSGKYNEESENVVKDYRVARAPLGLVLIFLIGIIGGFFGMGGGWAITPMLNLGMGLPLKLAAANSGVILGIGSCISVWPYVFSGGIIPLFALPWLAGQVVGGYIGSHALARVKVKFIRLVLIGIMAYTSFGLVTKGLELLGVIGGLPPLVHVGVFTVAAIGVAAAVLRRRTKAAKGDADKKNK